MPGNTDKVRLILKKLDSEPPIDVELVAKFFSINVVPYAGFPVRCSPVIMQHEGIRERFYLLLLGGQSVLVSEGLSKRGNNPRGGRGLFGMTSWGVSHA